MILFPSIAQPSYPLTEKWEDPAIRSTMENGTVVSRPRYTRNRETFVLNWGALSAADYALLRAFWKTTVLGGSVIFTWTYPVVAGDPFSGQPFNVRFTGGVPSFDLFMPGHYKGSLTIEEA